MKTDSESRQLKLLDTQHSELRTLRIFRWMILKAQRAEIDLIIEDLKEDCHEMQNEGRSPWFIKAVLFWQSVKIISIYTRVGLVGFIKGVSVVAAITKVLSFIGK